jgi:hypothetical protein
VLDFVTSSARSMALAAAERAHEPHGQWWAREQAALERIDIAGRYPLAARIGQAAGSSYGAAGDTSFAFTFGLDRLIASIADLVAHRSNQTG